MKTIKKKTRQNLSITVGLGLLTWGLVEACGNHFPMLLETRQATLREAIPFRLEQELALLEVKPLFDAKTSAALAALAKARVEPSPYETDLEQARKRQLKALDQGLEFKHREQLMKIRDAADGEAAYVMGEGLPTALQLYAAAAIDYRKPERKSQARERFEKILALNDADARPRAVWAAYSLGRLLREDDPGAAAYAYGKTRQWLLDGASDPLGLSIDSLGEEAWLLLHPGPGGERNAEQAMRLYLEQARLGSWSGTASLQQVQRGELYDDTVAVNKLLRSDWGQALLLRLALDENLSEDAKRRYARLASAVGSGQVQLREADRWAALAWQNGDIERARSWLAQAPSSSLAAWMRAKFALLSGKGAEATQHYAEALKLRRPAMADIPAHRLGIEMGLHQVQRGDYVQALGHLNRAGPEHWYDTAYIADRLLTIEELKTAVESLGKEPVSKEVRPLWPRLQHLLARRLMRNGQFAAALPLFSDRYETEKWNGRALEKRSTDLRQLAGDYAKALQAADKAWTRVGRAAELMRAGRIARQWGLELMGFELGGDDLADEGSYDFRDNFERADEPLSDLERSRKDASLKTLPLANAGGDKLPRFHYRYVAAEHALQAAALVPARSQAYASSLCHAAAWVGGKDEPFQQAMYARYLKNGAAMPGMSTFGLRCPEPQWSGAARLQARQALRERAPWLHRHPYRSAAAALLVTSAAAAAIATLLIRRRRRAG